MGEISPTVASTGTVIPPNSITPANNISQRRFLSRFLGDDDFTERDLEEPIQSESVVVINAPKILIQSVPPIISPPA